MNLKNLFSRNKNSASLQTRDGAVAIRFVNQNAAFDEWRSRTSALRRAGKCVLVLGSEESLAKTSQFMEENQDGAASRDLRLEADNVSVSAFLDFRRKVIEEDQEVDAVSLEQLDRMAIGPQHSYALTQGKGPVAVSELPCPDYEVFAHLPFGDWNEVPKDAELIAVLRHWGAKYGASLFAIGADWIELYLEKPISEPEVASDFATELFLVCPDCVYQGVQSMQALAQTILNARFLFLWWD